MVERLCDLGYVTLKNICHSEQHIRELSNAFITRIANLDHRDRGRGVVEVATSGRNGRPDLANYSATSWEEDRVSDNVGTGREKENFATSIGSSNVIEISGIVCSSIPVYWVSGDVLDIDKLSHIIRLIRWWWESSIFAIGVYECRRSAGCVCGAALVGSSCSSAGYVGIAIYPGLGNTSRDNRGAASSNSLFRY
jgi:hypothetical protein